MSQNNKVLNFGKLFLGNSLGQIVALALYPYIARFYLPSDFSTFGFMVSLTTLLSIFATGQFHTALMNPESEEEVRGLIGLSTILVTLFSVGSAIFFVFYDHSLLPVSCYLFVCSLFEIQKMYFVRKKMYSETATSQVIFRLVGNGSKLLTPFIALKSVGLILSEIFSLCLVVGYGLKKSIFNWQWQPRIFRKYKHFPLFQSFTVAIGLIIQDFPILFWAGKFDNTLLGHFVIGQKLIVLPALIISNAIQNSTVHGFIESKKPQRYYLKLIGGLVGLGILGILVFGNIGTQLLTMLLGENWAHGEKVFTLLSFLMLTKFAYSISQATFVLRGITKRTLFVRGGQATLLLLLINSSLSFYESLKLYIILDITCDAILIIWAGYIIRAPFLFRDSLK